MYVRAGPVVLFRPCIKLDNLTDIDMMLSIMISCSSLVQHVKAQLASNPRFQQAMDDITEFHTKTGSLLIIAFLPRRFLLV